MMDEAFTRPHVVAALSHQRCVTDIRPLAPLFGRIRLLPADAASFAMAWVGDAISVTS
jgi:hypothetical protein